MQNWRIYLAAGFLVILFITGALLVSQQARQSIPLRYAHIPEETKRFLRELERTGGDIWIRFIEKPIKDLWRNRTNEGEEPRRGFLKMEDENFILYYHAAPDEQAKANIVWPAAHQAIIPLADLFGKYYYPRDCNGRKLALYICENRKEYDRFRSTANPQSIAFTSLLSSPSGMLCRGIYFAPETFADAGGRQRNPKDVQETVWHEMAHFIYFSSLDLSRNLQQPQWVYEGIAEYFSDDRDRLREVDPQALIPLRQFESPQMRDRWVVAAYWMGYTAFLYMEQGYTRNGVRRFLGYNYHMPPSPAVEGALGVSFDQFDLAWQNYVRSKTLGTERLR